MNCYIIDESILQKAVKTDIREAGIVKMQAAILSGTHLQHTFLKTATICG